MPTYKPFGERTPDSQYQDAVRGILEGDEYVKHPFQDKGTYTRFDLPPLVYYFGNGFPLITERRIGFWKKNVNEIFAFVNGTRTLDQLRQFGNEKTWPNFWQNWVTPKKCADFGLEPGDLGPASYGPAMHDYPTPDGGTFNQFLEVLREMRDFPSLRTHLVTTWMPFGTIQHNERQRQVVVAPCHGTVIRMIVIDNHLTLQHVQRSADILLGGVGNILQYAALTLAIAQVLGVTAYRYIHIFLDAQIYEDQVNHARELIRREPRRLPTMKIIDPTIDDIFAFRASHFEVCDYEPHPAMNDIPYTE